MPPGFNARNAAANTSFSMPCHAQLWMLRNVTTRSAVPSGAISNLPGASTDHCTSLYTSGCASSIFLSSPLYFMSPGDFDSGSIAAA